MKSGSTFDQPFPLQVAAYILALAALAAAPAAQAVQKRIIETKFELSGRHVVPPVTTAAKATATITVIEDRSVVGSVEVKDLKATAVEIRDGAPGKNGELVIKLVNRGADAWILPTAAKLTEAQMKSLKAGNLYILVSSEKYEKGELRAPIR